MSTVLQLARLALIQNVRRQVHLATLFVAGILLVLPAYVNAFSLGVGAFERIAKDFGLTLIAYYGVSMAILLGATAIPGDAEGRTLLPLLARPLTRAHYVVGKFLGIGALLVGSLLFLGCFLVLSVGLLARSLDGGILLAVVGYALECTVLSAATILFSTFASPALAGVLGVFTYLIGGLSNNFIQFFLVEDRQGYLAAALATTLKALMPHFDVFRIKNAIVHAQPLDPAYVAAMGVYAAAWCALFLILAEWSFSRRDL